MSATDNPHPWYAMDDVPPGTVRVRLRWPGYEVEAVGSLDKRGKRHWHEVRGRELLAIAANPTAWQPLNPGNWQWPNGWQPLPLPVQVMPAVAMIGGMEFDAVEAAREMEEWREAAHGSRCQEDELAAVANSQWWRDVTLVKYEPPGSVSLEMAEARVMRHLILERSMPPDMRRARSNAAVLAELKLTWADIYASQARGNDWQPPVAAVASDWKDFEIVMMWMIEAVVAKREMVTLRGRMQTPPATWPQIGDEIGRTAQRAGQIYRDVIERLAAAANGRLTRAPAELSALRERNRKARGK